MWRRAVAGKYGVTTTGCLSAAGAQLASSAVHLERFGAGFPLRRHVRRVWREGGSKAGAQRATCGQAVRAAG